MGLGLPDLAGRLGRAIMKLTQLSQPAKHLKSPPLMGCLPSPFYDLLNF